MRQDRLGWIDKIRARLAQWRDSRPDRLIRLAQGAMLAERLARAFLPTAIVIGLFVALSWTGLWLGAPSVIRILGASALFGAVVAALTQLRKFARPRLDEARDAVDAGDPAAPAATLADSLANRGDPQTQSLWRLHQRRAQRRAKRLKPVFPSLRFWTEDPYAFGALAVLALVAAGFLAGPEKYARLAAAFDWRWHDIAQAPSRIDAWIDPPPYTGKPPIVLTMQRSGAAGETIPAPVGSAIIVRAVNATDLRVTAEQGVRPAAEGEKKDRAATESRFTLLADGRLSVSRGASHVASFAFKAIPDLPPKISPIGAPKVNLHGSFEVKYRIEDDYGARDARVAARLLTSNAAASHPHPLVEPPSGSLDLPPGLGGLGEGKTTLDWSDSPYAGARVDLVFEAHDEAGNAGEGVIRNFTLPGKIFSNPLALALIEQRRILALDAGQKDRVQAAIDALMASPEIFTPNAGVYLGLRFAHDSLRHANGDSELKAVVDLLWEMALQIENGDVPQAERDLKAAEQALRDAIKRGASQEEIARLTDQLQKALDQYLSALQEKAKGGQKSETETGNGRSVTPKDLKSMLDRMAEAAKAGDKDAAMQMLDRMQEMLENLRAAQNLESSRQAAQNRRMMRDIDNMMREQQKLRDDTFARDHGEQAQGDTGQEKQDQSPQDSGNQGQQPGRGARGDRGSRSSQDQSDQALQHELGRRQGQLREKLEALKREAAGAGEKSRGLTEAGEAMKQAEQSLQSEDNPSAVDAQGRALDGLRKGASEIARQNEQNGPSDDPEEAGQKNGQGTKGQNGEGRFGRANNQNNIDATAAQKARKVLEELRRRLSDPSRAREELDYIERLIKPD